MNDKSTSKTVSRNQRNVRWGFLLALAFFAFASSATAQPTISRGEQLLPISYNECIQRAEQAYLAEGWVNLGKGGAFVNAFKENNGAYITCNVAPENKIWVNIFVASNSGDGNVPGGERVKLQRRMDNSGSTGGCNTPTISGFFYLTSGDPVGVMVIDRQNGNYISLRYGKDENSLLNRMEGTFKCNVLTGTFTNTVYNSSGTIEFRFAADGSSFAGIWRNNGGGSGPMGGTKR